MADAWSDSDTEHEHWTEVTESRGVYRRPGERGEAVSDVAASLVNEDYATSAETATTGSSPLDSARARRDALQERYDATFEDVKAATDEVERLEREEALDSYADTTGINEPPDYAEEVVTPEPDRFVPEQNDKPLVYTTGDPKRDQYMRQQGFRVVDGEES